MAVFQEAKDKFYRLRCERAAKALEKNGFTAVVVDDRQQAADKLLELIEPGASVGVPGSVTIRELGIMERLESRGNKVAQHWVPGASKEESHRLRLQEMLSDVLLTSTNALSLDGKLVNIDGGGNRVASMVFGPEKTIVVAGANKLCDNLDEALLRAKHVAAPINAVRLNLNTPCAVTGQCGDCKGSSGICNVTVIIERQPGHADITVLLVAEDLGY